MAQKKYVLGTRGSDLALFQSNFIKNQIESNSDIEIELKTIKTTGDMILDKSFTEMNTQSVFTKEIEEALLKKEIDLAVHSLKDLMTVIPDGLKIGAVGFREDRRELLIYNKKVESGEGLIPLKLDAVIGTSSVRRQCQLYNYNQKYTIKNLRGNIPTRIEKLRDGMYDAIIIAAAGVYRLKLDLSDMEAKPLDPEQFLPAPGQGILAIQIRDNDSEVESFVSALDSSIARKEVVLERGLLAKFRAGCSLPLGVFSEVHNNNFRLLAVLGEPEKIQLGHIKRVDMTGDNIEQLVSSVYKQLINK